MPISSCGENGVDQGPRSREAFPLQPIADMRKNSSTATSEQKTDDDLESEALLLGSQAISDDGRDDEDMPRNAKVSMQKNVSAGTEIHIGFHICQMRCSALV